MDKTTRNLLITGVPGIGKSTLIKKLIGELKSAKPVGFFTEEIRIDGTRKGFELISLDGRKRNLAHIDCRSRFLVGKYRVNVYGFEKFLDRLDLAGSPGRMVIIDEIGKMECLSQKFREIVEELLDQDRVVVATVSRDGGGFMEAVRRREDITLLDMTKRNRAAIAGKVLRKIRALRFS